MDAQIFRRHDRVGKAATIATHFRDTGSCLLKKSFSLQDEQHAAVWEAVQYFSLARKGLTLNLVPAASRR